MNKTISQKHRKQLQQKMTKVFQNDIKTLSQELQQILTDDLVTAFQNRINVLIRAQPKRS